MSRKGIIVAAIATGLAFEYLAFWFYTRPVLDPTGEQDSAPAVRAMLEGGAVRNAVTGRLMTETGWPFFDRYTAEGPRPSSR